MSEVPDIKKNYIDVLDSVNKITEECGRKPDSVRLIAVSKTKPAEYIKEAMEAGAVDFGENKPQELAAKYEQVSGVRWHQIGHLQKNKVRHIIGKTALIHSLDSIELAKEIDKRAKAVGIVQDVLIQVNISGEESKFGIKPENLPEMLESLKEFSNVNTTGLMTKLFSKLKELGSKYGLREFSMGMSHDYKEAIESGATMVRVGTSIFGERDYSLK